MPLQNRINPSGDTITTQARGTFMGNRGIIHDPISKQLLTRRWQHKAWIWCVLEFKGFQHPIMGPGAYTELFFLDEVTALAAGHRPCGYCRRSDFNSFKQHWKKAKQLLDNEWLSAPAMDKVLHSERVTRQRQKISFTTNIDDLSDGVFVAMSGKPHLILGDQIFPWTPEGYSKSLVRPPAMQVTVLTPRSIVEVMAAGYVANVHNTANQ